MPAGLARAPVPLGWNQAPPGSLPPQPPAPPLHSSAANPSGAEVSPHCSGFYGVRLTGFNGRLVSNLSFNRIQASSAAPAPPCFSTIRVSSALGPPHPRPCRWKQPVLKSLPRLPAFLVHSSPGPLPSSQRKPTAVQQAHHTRLPRGLACPRRCLQGSPFHPR